MKLSVLSFVATCLLLSGTALASGQVTVSASGTCNDGTQVTGNGAGADPDEATNEANRQIDAQCEITIGRGGVKSYDSAVITSDTRP